MIVTIIADHRERASETYRRLVAHPKVALRSTELEVGDYLVAHSVLVERKTAQDFQRSVISQRIFRQARLLLRSRYQPMFLLEGSAGWLAHPHAGRSGLSHRAWQGALVTLSLIWGIPVLRTESPAESAWLLRNIAAQRTRVTSAPRRPRVMTKNPKRRQLQFLTGLPGVGGKRATALLAAFGSVRGVLNAEPEALIRVDGIGVIVAQRIAAFASGEDSGSQRPPRELAD